MFPPRRDPAIRDSPYEERGSGGPGARATLDSHDVGVVEMPVSLTSLPIRAHGAS